MIANALTQNASNRGRDRPHPTLAEVEVAQENKNKTATSIFPDFHIVTLDIKYLKENSFVVEF